MKTYKDSAKKKVLAKKQTITKKNQMKILELKKCDNRNRKQTGELSSSTEAEGKSVSWETRPEKLLQLSNRGK